MFIDGESPNLKRHYDLIIRKKTNNWKTPISHLQHILKNKLNYPLSMYRKHVIEDLTDNFNYLTDFIYKNDKFTIDLKFNHDFPIDKFIIDYDEIIEYMYTWHFSYSNKTINLNNIIKLYNEYQMLTIQIEPTYNLKVKGEYNKYMDYIEYDYELPETVYVIDEPDEKVLLFLNKNDAGNVIYHEIELPNENIFYDPTIKNCLYYERF